MTWSYSLSLATPKDQVRLLIGDTDNSDQLLQDEEISFYVSRVQAGGINDVGEAAAQACESIAARYARQADKTVGDLNIKLSQKAKAYQERADYIRSQMLSPSGAIVVPPFAGGISRSQKNDTEDDTDRVQPFFRRRMSDLEHGEDIDQRREFWTEPG